MGQTNGNLKKNASKFNLKHCIGLDWIGIGLDWFRVKNGSKINVYLQLNSYQHWTFLLAFIKPYFLVFIYHFIIFIPNRLGSLLNCRIESNDENSKTWKMVVISNDRSETLFRCIKRNSSFVIQFNIDQFEDVW